jgi:hypothetical protein
VPAIEFLEAIPEKLAAEIHAVLDAVAAAPPPSFSGGGKWQAMHGDMAGFFEVRVQGGAMNHRLFLPVGAGSQRPWRLEHRLYRRTL